MANTSKKLSITTTEHNFSLLADPNKIKDVSKTVLVKDSNHKHDNDSVSSKSNLIDVNDPDSDINFVNKNHANSVKSSKSSKSSTSASVSRRSRHETIKREIHGTNSVEKEKRETGR